MNGPEAQSQEARGAFAVALGHISRPVLTEPWSGTSSIQEEKRQSCCRTPGGWWGTRSPWSLVVVVVMMMQERPGLGPGLCRPTTGIYLTGLWGPLPS